MLMLAAADTISECKLVNDDEAFDGLRAQLAAHRAQFYMDVPSCPFYGYNRPGAKPSQGVINNWWRQGMMGGTKAHYDCIKAFSETDFTEDLKKISQPALVLHGDEREASQRRGVDMQTTKNITPV